MTHNWYLWEFQQTVDLNSKKKNHNFFLSKSQALFNINFRVLMCTFQMVFHIIHLQTTDDMVSTLTWSIFIKKGAFNDVKKPGIYFILGMTILSVENRTFLMLQQFSKNSIFKNLGRHLNQYIFLIKFSLFFYILTLFISRQT